MSGGRAALVVALGGLVMGGVEAAELIGNGHAQDSFALVIQAVLREFGREVAYEELAPVAGGVFAPCHNLGEDCCAWWASDRGRDDNLDLVAARFGLRVQRLGERRADDFADLPEERVAWDDYFRTKFRLPWVARLRAELADGAAPICADSWNPKSPGGFVPWAWWGIVTEVGDDGSIRGACLNGRSDNALWLWRYGYVLRAGDVTIDQPSTDRAAWARAAARLRGDAPSSSGGDQQVYGVKAVDAWVERMDRVPFCEACGDESWGCATDTARPVIEGAKVAAAYLRQCAERAPSVATDLKAAADGYDRVIARLAPTLNNDDPNSYRSLIGDLARQRRHIVELKAVREEFLGIAESLDAAVAAVPAG